MIPPNSNADCHSVVSALYCKLLVVLGLAFPLSEVVSPAVPHGFYQVQKGDILMIGLFAYIN